MPKVVGGKRGRGLSWEPMCSEERWGVIGQAHRKYWMVHSDRTRTKMGKETGGKEEARLG